MIERKTWKEKVQEITDSLKGLKEQLETQQILSKPFEERIEEIQKAARPYWKKRNEIFDKIRKLEWQLKVALEEKFFESLQIGSQVEIYHDSFYRGRYLTVRTEAPRKAKVHTLEILETGKVFLKAKRLSDKAEFIGTIYRFSAGLPELRWRKA